MRLKPACGISPSHSHSWERGQNDLMKEEGDYMIYGGQHPPQKDPNTRRKYKSQLCSFFGASVPAICVLLDSRLQGACWWSCLLLNGGVLCSHQHWWAAAELFPSFRCKTCRRKTRLAAADTGAIMFCRRAWQRVGPLARRSFKPTPRYGESGHLMGLSRNYYCGVN